MKELICGWLWFSMLTAVVAISVGASVFWIWILIEILARETDENNTRLIWTLVVIFTHWLGALIYLLSVAMSESINSGGKQYVELHTGTGLHLRTLTPSFLGWPFNWNHRLGAIRPLGLGAD